MSIHLNSPHGIAVQSKTFNMSLNTIVSIPWIVLVSRLASIFVFSLYVPMHAQSAPPNVVFILADDLGYGELGCYGQTKIRTPNLDRLASQGMRLVQHYSGAPVCAPSRCVLLTGQNLTHAEIRGNRDSGNGRPFPGQWPLTADIVTLAEMFQGQGYATGGFGKWGLGPTDSSGSPIRQGFDRFFGYNCQRNAHSYYPPFLDSDETTVVINERPVAAQKRKMKGDVSAEDYRSENYAPDVIMIEALKFLDQNASRSFFLYLPMVEPHVAMQPKQEWIDQYPLSWDEEFGAYRGENGYLPHPRPRAAYAAMISDLDDHVGKVMAKLDSLGIAENTLIVFTSDNGPTHRGQDPRWHVGGAACDFFDSTAGLKGFKGSCDEGGIRVPCIVKWPGKIQPGTTSSVPSYFADWFPTLCSMVGGPLPNPEQQPMDGIDLKAALLGEQVVDRKEPMMWEFPEYGGYVAIRDGNWKALRRGLKTKTPGRWELYDLEADPAESNNLAGEFPDIVQRLEKAHRQTRKSQPNFPFEFFDQ